MRLNRWSGYSRLARIVASTPSGVRNRKRKTSAESIPAEVVLF